MSELSTIIKGSVTSANPVNELSVAAVSSCFLSCLFAHPIFVRIECPAKRGVPPKQAYRIEYLTGAVQIAIGEPIDESWGWQKYFNAIQRAGTRFSTCTHFFSIAEPIDTQGISGYAFSTYTPELSNAGIPRQGMVHYWGKLPGRELLSSELLSVFQPTGSEMLRDVGLFVQVNPQLDCQKNPVFIIREQKGTSFRCMAFYRRKDLIMEIKKVNIEQPADPTVVLEVQLGAIELTIDDFLSLEVGSQITLEAMQPLTGFLFLEPSHSLAAFQIHFENESPVLTLTQSHFDGAMPSSPNANR